MKFTLVVPSLLLLGACATAPAVPDALRPTAGETASRTLHARGVQIYECRTKKDAPQSAEWAFVAPEADLFDGDGAPIGRHYAGPRWESFDGSKVVGNVKSRADAPQAGAIPWLLLATQSDGPAGSFARVTSIQRINTVGGAAPAADTCTPATVGHVARIRYSADYVLFTRS